MKKHFLFFLVFTAGASALYAQSGNVGIGTTTPQTKLDVKNNSAGDHTLGLGGLAPSIRFYGGDTLPSVGPVTFNVPYAKIGLATQTGQFAHSAVPGDFVIQTVDTNKSIIFSNLFGGGNGFEQMRLSGNGNLGISTSTPTAKLHVAGNVRIADGTQGLNKIFTSDTNGTGSWKTATELGFGSGWALAGNNLAGSEILGSTNAQPLRIVTDSIERMRVTETGNVGIGTSTPQTKLQIQNDAVGDNALAIGGSAPSIRLYGGPTLPATVPSTFNVPYAKIGLATVAQQFTASSIPGDLVIQTIDTNNSIIFSNNFAGGGFEQMRLNGNGNLGIGTATPAAKLHVAGNIRIADGTQGAGKILTSDANGNASWQPAPGTVVTTGLNNEPQDFTFITPPTTEYIANCPITLNKGTYTLYYYVQYDYYQPGSTTNIRVTDPTNATTLASTFPRYIYFSFVTSSGSADFPSYPFGGTNTGPHVIPVINYFQVVSKISQLVVVHQDGTVIRPRYWGIPAYGRISSMNPIIAVKM